MGVKFAGQISSSSTFSPTSPLCTIVKCFFKQQNCNKINPLLSWYRKQNSKIMEQVFNFILYYVWFDPLWPFPLGPTNLDWGHCRAENSWKMYTCRFFAWLHPPTVRQQHKTNPHYNHPPTLQPHQHLGYDRTWMIRCETGTESEFWLLLTKTRTAFKNSGSS